MEKPNQFEKYEAAMAGIHNNDELLAYVQKHEKDIDFPDLLDFFINRAIDIISKETYKYTDEFINQNSDVKLFLELCKYGDAGNNSYFRALQAFFQKKYKICEKELTISVNNLFADPEFVLDSRELGLSFIGPFKNAYKGFWDFINNLFENKRIESGVLDLCRTMKLVYESDDNETIINSLEQIYAKNNSLQVVKELLGYAYYEEKMWGNSVAMLEQVEENYIFFPDDMFFMMGVAYGQLKDLPNEIEAYKKSVEIYPQGAYSCNNLGYAYYKAKQFNKALECFNRCIDMGIDLKYASNNYVRTLLSMKRYKDAKAFVKNPPAKIIKSLLDKVKNAESINKRISADEPILDDVDDGEFSVESKPVELGIKKQQFSSEKLLEDELTMRIEAGFEVFGHKLKIYRRKGVYGRQYILPTGKRLDLLCEDDAGTLYIIELKKDSGYDDAYVQTAEYLDWFEKNWKEHKKIEGIICLNNPSKELLDKVHADKRMRVFEYQISYTER